MTIKMKMFVFTFIFSILLNSGGGYIQKTNLDDTLGMAMFSPAQAYAIAVDYKVCPSCKIYFTQKVRRGIERNNLNLKTIQYYNSGEILLSRLVKKDKHRASSGGVLKYRSGKLTEQIKIFKLTPGICVQHNMDTLYMSFGKDKKFKLPFKNKREYYQLNSTNGKIIVNNIEFDLLKGKTSILIIQKHDTKIRTIRKKTLRGNVIKN